MVAGWWDMFLSPAGHRIDASSRIGTRLRWGVRWGVYYTVVLVAWVGLIWLLRGSDPFERQGVTLLAVLTLYVVAGPVTGGMVGLLLPLAKSALGAAITGVVAAVPVSVMTIATVGGFPPWTRQHTISTILMAVVGGALGGYMFRRVLSDDA